MQQPQIIETHDYRQEVITYSFKTKRVAILFVLAMCFIGPVFTIIGVKLFSGIHWMLFLIGTFSISYKSYQLDVIRAGGWTLFMFAKAFMLSLIWVPLYGVWMYFILTLFHRSELIDADLILLFKRAVVIFAATSLFFLVTSNKYNAKMLQRIENGEDPWPREDEREDLGT